MYSEILPTVNYTSIILWLALTGVVILLLALAGYVAVILFKNRDREKRSLNSVMFQIAVPRGNEIKIDAMEQLFASLYSVKKGGWKQKYSIQPTISFEIVAKIEDIKFYVWAPKDLRDVVERQIHGAYPDAEVLEVPEYNIFNEQGKVAYKSYQLGKANYLPIKTFRELATDPLASITSALGKMDKGEGVSIQVLISPVDSKWQKNGRGFISETKKSLASGPKLKIRSIILRSAKNPCIGLRPREGKICYRSQSPGGGRK